MSSKDLLLYDAECGFCTRVADNLWRLRLDLDVRPMQEVDLPSLGVDEDRAQREMPVVRRTGEVDYGHLAWSRALRAGNRPLRLAGAVLAAPVVSPLVGRVYAWVSANRHRMPGGTPACTRPTVPTA